MIRTILTLWARLGSAVIGLLLLAASCVLLGGAALRAVAPLHAIDRAEEVALYLIILATVLSGAAQVADGGHISTKVFVNALPPDLRRILGWAVIALAAGFCVAMMMYGWQAFEFALLLDERSTSTLRAPQAYAVFLALLVGMALMQGWVGLILLAGQRSIAPVEDSD